MLPDRATLETALADLDTAHEGRVGKAAFLEWVDGQGVSLFAAVEAGHLPPLHPELQKLLAK